MEPSIDEKQSYLRKEIMDKDFDVEEFMLFFTEFQIGNDFDLDKVTYKELQRIVSDFQNSKQKQKRASSLFGNEILNHNSNINTNTTNNNNNIQNTNISSSTTFEPKDKLESIISEETITNTDNPNSNMIFDKNVDNDTPNDKESNTRDIENHEIDDSVKVADNSEHNIDIMINCCKLNKTRLTDEKYIGIEVCNPKIVKGGIFSSNYVVYTIKCEALKSEVVRRYSDFEWFRRELLKSFPNYYIPPIPIKQTLDNLSDNIIVKRTINFNYFLNHLINIPSIKASKILYDFLTINNDIEFSKKKTEYEIFNNNIKFENLSNLQGIIYCRYNNEYDKQHSNLKDYIKQKDLLLSKLSTNYTNLQEEFKKVSLIMNSISETFKQLRVLSEDYKDNKTEKETYQQMENTYKELSLNYKSQNNIIETDFKEFFDYYKLEVNTFKERTQLFEDYKEEYFKAYSNLKVKKEKLFNLKNIHKWELSIEDLETADNSLLNNKELAFSKMCKSDTIILNKKLTKLGVSAYSMLNEMNKFKFFYGKIFESHFSTLCERNTEFLSQIFAIIKSLGNVKKTKNNNSNTQNISIAHRTNSSSNLNTNNKIKEATNNMFGDK